MKSSNIAVFRFILEPIESRWTGWMEFNPDSPFEHQRPIFLKKASVNANF